MGEQQNDTPVAVPIKADGAVPGGEVPPVAPAPGPDAVTPDIQTPEPDTVNQVTEALNIFYKNYIVTTIDGSFQVFKSMTYGEMAICFLLFCILLVMVFRWFYDALV